jgi:hypothetical protein
MEHGMTNPPEIIWTSPVDKCDLCGSQIVDIFIDGNYRGCWALFCPGCAEAYNIKLGTGLGQRYELRQDEKQKYWLKVEG